MSSPNRENRFTPTVILVLVTAVVCLLTSVPDAFASQTSQTTPNLDFYSTDPNTGRESYLGTVAGYSLDGTTFCFYLRAPSAIVVVGSQHFYRLTSITGAGVVPFGGRD